MRSDAQKRNVNLPVEKYTAHGYASLLSTLNMKRKKNGPRTPNRCHPVPEGWEAHISPVPYSSIRSPLSHGTPA